MSHPAPWLTWQNSTDAQTLQTLSSNSPYLTTASFNDYRGKVEADFGLALGLALTKNTRLKTLDIFRKHFSDADMHFLALALTKNSSISHLKITGSALGHMGIVALASALKRAQLAVWSHCC